MSQQPTPQDREPESLETLYLLKEITKLPYNERYAFYVGEGLGQNCRDRLHVGLSRIKKKIDGMKFADGARPKRFRMKSRVVFSDSDGDMVEFWKIQTDLNKSTETLDEFFAEVSTTGESK